MFGLSLFYGEQYLTVNTLPFLHKTFLENFLSKNKSQIW